LKTGLNNILLPMHIVPGTMLNNIVNNQEQYGQQNIDLKLITDE
jgi:hypothetical protein